MDAIEFVNAIVANPWDSLSRLMYADWLQEQGDQRGELLLIQEELRQTDLADRPAGEARMQEMLRLGVEPLAITWRNCLEMEFVLIFPGDHLMGSRPDRRDRWDWEFGQREQQLQAIAQPFYLGRFPVTQTAWLALMGTRPWADGADDGADFPATYVSWDECVEFCHWLNALEEERPPGWEYRLPSQAQWEYACRAGTSTRYSFGDDAAELDRFAWHNTPAGERLEGPQAVGRKKPNPWGLYDMHGNVWEWCLDWWDGVAPILRGGAWSSVAEYCRSTVQNGASRNSRWDAYGFRVALTPPAAP